MTPGNAQAGQGMAGVLHPVSLCTLPCSKKVKSVTEELLMSHHRCKKTLKNID